MGYRLILGSVLLGPLAAVGCGDDPPPPPAEAQGGSLGRGGAVASAARGGDDARGGDARGDGGDDLAGGSGKAGEGGSLPDGGAPAAACNGGKGATISGRVLAPNGELPLSGVTVYVPSSTVDPLPNGVGCWSCASAWGGNPIALATTDADGRFEITNVAAGEQVPLVVQTGKWQRQLVLESVADCQENPVSSADTRLPRNSSEGRLPRMALVSGGEDTLECLLRKLGIDDSEFTFSPGAGSVQLFSGKGGMTQLDGVPGSALSAATALWSDPAALGVFDLVLLGSESDRNAAEKPAAAIEAVHDYAAAGGRVLLQHFQNYFLQAGAAGGNEVATFGQQPDLPEPFTVQVDVSSPRGLALADSLLASASASDAASEFGKFSLNEGRNSMQAVSSPGVRLLYAESPATVQAFSLDLGHETQPVCGRITATDVLTASGDRVDAFPAGCDSTSLNTQERALAFLLFDLGACL